MTLFQRYIGIDYSGAGSPDGERKNICVYESGSGEAPKKVGGHWSRKELANWLKTELSGNTPTIAGIDHGFSFPLAYFEKYKIKREWSFFLDDFCRHWETNRMPVSTAYECNMKRGKDSRLGEPQWLRLTERRTSGAKSVFGFRAGGASFPGGVAHSTHAGIPWLRFLRKQWQGKVHFWPFDGWDAPAGQSVLAEIYPSLWSRAFPRENRSRDQQDAYASAAWLQLADREGCLASFLKPCALRMMEPEECAAARLEGWILGVGA